MGYYGAKHELYRAIFDSWQGSIDERLAGLRAAASDPQAPDALARRFRQPRRGHAQPSGGSVLRADGRTRPFRQWLKISGVDHKQVSFVEAPFPQHADLIRGGTVDAVVSGGPFMARIVDRNKVVNRRAL